MISQNNTEIDKLRVKDRTTANEKGRKEIMHELDTIMKNTTRTGQECKAYLDHIKQDNVKYNQENKVTSSHLSQQLLILCQCVCLYLC
jgi:hypothetical protein